MQLKRINLMRCICAYRVWSVDAVACHEACEGVRGGVLGLLHGKSLGGFQARQLARLGENKRGAARQGPRSSA